MTVKEKLAAGQKVYGTMLKVTRNPAIAYLAKNAGLDFVMYDCEHTEWSMETLHDCFITGNALGIESFLRVPVAGKQYISRALDQGAHGVMVPMCENAEIAGQLVKYSKYQPIGGRGFSGAIAHTDYLPVKHNEYMQKANATVLSIAQVETKETLNHLDEIAALEGIDVLLVGPNDLSVSLGIPGDLMNPIEIEAIHNVAAAAHRHGKYFSLHAGPAMLKLFEDELDLVMCQGDSDYITAGFKSILKVFDK